MTFWYCHPVQRLQEFSEYCNLPPIWPHTHRVYCTKVKRQNLSPPTHQQILSYNLDCLLIWLLLNIVASLTSKDIYTAGDSPRCPLPHPAVQGGDRVGQGDLLEEPQEGPPGGLLRAPSPPTGRMSGHEQGLSSCPHHPCHSSILTRTPFLSHSSSPMDPCHKRVTP